MDAFEGHKSQSIENPTVLVGLWPSHRMGWAGLGLGWGLQAVAKQSGRSFLHPAAAAVAMAVGPQPISIGTTTCLGARG